MHKEQFHCTIPLHDLSQAIAIKLPPRAIPKDFLRNTVRYVCGGYFIGFDCSYTPQDLCNFFEQRQVATLAQKAADFLIIFIDKVTKETLLLTGQSGRFPCYFTIADGMLHLSTDLGWVKKQLKHASLNFDFILNSFTGIHEMLLTDETCFREIWQVPPATLLTVDHEGGFSLAPLINLHNYLPKEQEYAPAEFAEKVVSLLHVIIDEHVQAIQGLPFAAELSSGFDSSLVSALLAKKTKEQLTAISHVSTLSPAYNVPSITQRFCQQHNIDLRLVNIDGLFLFSDHEGVEILRRHPYAIDLTYITRKQFAALGKRVIFEGTGGDEMYKAGRSTKWFRYPLQLAYFRAITRVKKGLNKLFTEEGLERLHARERFATNALFASGISTSAITVKLRQFPTYWETGTWGIAPLSDPRLTQLATFGPKSGTKRSVWEGREDIYTSEQLNHAKGDFDKHMAQILTNPKTKQKVVNILETSLLTKNGIIRGDDIINDLQSGKEGAYLDDLLPTFVSVIYMEHFPQNNIASIG